MNVKVRALCAATAWLLFGSAAWTYAAPPATNGQPTQNVNVVNDGSNPVPVSGSVVVTGGVTISNGVASPVPVTGNVGVTGAVTVANTPNVTVTNLPAMALEPGRSPYQQRINFNPGPSNCPNEFFCFVSFPAVPAGKRLVVTFISAQFSLGGAAAEAAVGVNNSSNIATSLEIPATPIGGSRFLGAGPVMFFVDAGQSPTVFYSGTVVTPSTNSAWASVVGYLVPAL